MDFSYGLIQEITTGAVRTEIDGGDISFYRFTEEQERFYEQNKPDLYAKTFATAGVKMRFFTDGTALRLKVAVRKQTSSRTFFAADVFVNGQYKGSIDNFSEKELQKKYQEQHYDFGEFEKTFMLGDGEKDVEIYFPWSVALNVCSMEAVGATFVRANRPNKKLLVFGDSITQGYDALHPYKRYAARLADALGAEEVNKAIGAEIFVPELAAISDGFSPDYISVAYGTNDWSKTDFTDFKARCESFFRNLTENYPESRIFALTPIWRKDYGEKRHGWDFSAVEETLREVAAKHANITVVRGFGLVPQDERYFSDLYVHPNDDGFVEYAQNLIKEIKKLNV